MTFFFLKKNIVKEKFKYFNDGGGKSLVVLLFKPYELYFIISLNGIPRVTQPMFLIQFLVL